MIQVNFVRPAAIAFNGVYLTDHNRGPVEVSTERIENRVRTQGGDMRKYYRADKHSFSVSWQQLPETNADTIDGELGAREIQDFYLATTDDFTLTITYDNGDTDTYEVVFDDFSMSLTRRYGYANLYDVSISLEEV